MQADQRFQQVPYPRRRESPVGQRGGQASHFSNQIRFDKQTIPPRSSLFLDPLLFPRGHETREIDLVRVGWGVRTVVVTELAVITFSFNPFIIRGGHLGDVACIVINAIQQRIEGRTEVETPSTAVADVEHATGFLFETFSVPVRGDEVNAFHQTSYCFEEYNT